MHELKRHAPFGRTRRLPNRDRPRGLPHLYAARRRGPIGDLYLTDRVEARRGGGFRWFFSTLLAAAVGAVAIAAVVLGSMDANEGRGGLMPALRRANDVTASTEGPAARPARDGLRWSTPKADRLQIASGAMATKYIVQEPIRQRRGNREYIQNKPYARFVTRLAAVPAKAGVDIPPFNPVRLFASNAAGQGDADASPQTPVAIPVKVVDLLGSMLAIEDGQEIDNQEAADLVDKVATPGRDDAVIRSTFLPEGADVAPQLTGRGSRSLAEATPNTTVLEKTTVEPEEAGDTPEGQLVKVRLNKGETLTRLLQRLGAEPWLVREMMQAARTVVQETSITSLADIEVTMVPSLTQADKLEPVRIAVYEDGEHKLSVGRNAAGEFIASATPLDATPGRGSEGEQQMATSLYASLYHAALMQGLTPEAIQLVLKVHAYETDFRRRARGSDSIDLFFDMKEDERASEATPGELLYTAITVGGETMRYYRFRTPDGLVDYYDEGGNNSRKFLMRRPVRSDDMRIASGFGVRFHPLLNARKMHTGVDWAGPMGTPILAAGNGVVEEAGPKGQYGNYIRIRHANGYQTAYGHMRGFAAGMHAGMKVRQGQLIGYLGNTGLSTGPHVHFEVLVNNRFVDPMSIQVPREKKLEGRQLADFQRERMRIEDLMHRPPVRVALIEGH